MQRVLLSVKKSSLTCLALAHLAVGCGDRPEPLTLEVFSWWDGQAENSAFRQVKQVHERRHEHVTVRDVFSDTSVEARKELAERMLRGTPPATFQANIGADLLRWTVIDATDGGVGTEPLWSAKYVEPLDALFAKTGLERNIDNALLEPLRVPGEDGLYAVPINVHRLNVLYYNAAWRRNYERDHPEQSLEDIATWCPSEPSAPPLDARIAIGNDPQESFVLTLLTFENVLPALTNPEFYAALFRGEAPTTGTDPTDWTVDVERALACVQHLSRSFLWTTNWSQAVTAVLGGSADVTVMGDWANGQLGQALGEAVGSMAFPGTQGLFVFTSDTFPLPVGTRHRSEALKLLETIASAEGQEAFSNRKGSIPARDDVNFENLPAHAQATHTAFKSLPKVLATSGLLPAYYPLGDLERKLGSMVARSAGRAEVTQALNEFVAAHRLLGEWQRRLQRGAAESPPP